MREYESLEMRSRGDERALCGMALAHIGLGDPDGAIRRISDVVSSRPGAGYAHGMAGVVLQEIGRSEEALACYETMLSLDPGEISAYVRKAQILHRMGREKECRNTIDECLGAPWSGRESPKEVKRLRLLSGRLRGSGAKFTSADAETFIPGLWEMIDTAFGPGENRAESAELDLEGAVRTGTVDFDECARFLDDLIERFPDSGAAWCMKGMLMADADRVKEALACYDGSIKISPGEMVAYANKCDLLADSGDRAGILECMEEAARARPADGENARLQKEMRGLYERLKRGERYPDPESFSSAATTARWAAAKRAGLDAEDDFEPVR